MSLLSNRWIHWPMQCQSFEVFTCLPCALHRQMADHSQCLPPRQSQVGTGSFPSGPVGLQRSLCRTRRKNVLVWNRNHRWYLRIEVKSLIILNYNSHNAIRYRSLYAFVYSNGSFATLIWSCHDGSVHCWGWCFIVLLSRVKEQFQILTGKLFFHKSRRHLSIC